MRVLSSYPSGIAPIVRLTTDEALVIVKSDFISDLIPPVFVAKLWRFIDSATRGSGLNL